MKLREAINIAQSASLPVMLFPDDCDGRDKKNLALFVLLEENKKLKEKIKESYERGFNAAMKAHAQLMR